jgi:hypothetical protein
VLTRLRRKFPASDVKQRQGGGGKQLDYVAIETTIERFLTEAPDYSWRGNVVTIQQEPRYQDSNGDTKGGQWTAVVQGQLDAESKTGFGTCAMTNPDPDMAVKSANSEAFKNAAKNGFGVALELWSEEHRASLKTARSAAGGSEAALKKAVFDLAKEQLGKKKPTVAEVAANFGVDAGELADKATLERILTDQGVL